MPEIPEKAAVVFQTRPRGELHRRYAGHAQVFWLSENGAQEEVARSVFALLRRLDNAAFTSVFIEKSPESGIGVAVNDRLSRAAAK